MQRVEGTGVMKSITEQVVCVFSPPIACAICVTLSGMVHGAPIYSQITPSPPIGAFSSSDTATGQKIADNFRLNTAGSVTIRSLRFIGGYGVRNPPPATPPLAALPPDNFRVVFLTDEAGAPGVPLLGGDFNVGASVRRTPTGGPLLNGVYIPIEYSLDLGAGITVSPSAAYWVSIANNPGVNYFWDWARATGILDQRVAATLSGISTGSWSVSSGSAMFLELDDNNVPEPSCFVVLVSAACGNWLRGGHRSRPILHGAVRESGASRSLIQAKGVWDDDSSISQGSPSAAIAF